jgi:hypothetical protein
MPVNWAIETYKWYVLVNKFQSISFIKSFESVLSGLSFAMNTPNRIGEYGGRVLYLEPGFRLRGVALTVLCSVSQLLITLLFGWISLLILEKPLKLAHFTGTGFSSLIFDLFLYGTLIVSVITGIFFFRMPWLVSLMQRFPKVKEKFSFAFVLEHLTAITNGKILFYSFLRFIVFALQYVLVWNALQAEIDGWQGFWCISLVFLIMSIIPSFAIAEIGIKGKVALSIAGIFTANSLALLAGTVTLWLLNLALPALLGSIFLLTIKIFKER